MFFITYMNCGIVYTKSFKRVLKNVFNGYGDG